MTFGCNGFTKSLNHWLTLLLYSRIPSLIGQIPEKKGRRPLPCAPPASCWLLSTFWGHCGEEKIRGDEASGGGGGGGGGGEGGRGRRARAELSLHAVVVAL